MCTFTDKNSYTHTRNGRVLWVIASQKRTHDICKLAEREKCVQRVFHIVYRVALLLYHFEEGLCVCVYACEVLLIQKILISRNSDSNYIIYINLLMCEARKREIVHSKFFWALFVYTYL